MLKDKTYKLTRNTTLIEFRWKEIGSLILILLLIKVRGDIKKSNQPHVDQFILFITITSVHMSYI